MTQSFKQNSVSSTSINGDVLTVQIPGEGFQNQMRFLMEEGEKKRDLPLSESLVIAHRVTAALLLAVAFIFYVWVNS